MMEEHTHLEDMLRSEDGDPGCASADILDVYIELELAGENPERSYPGIAVHLRACPACRADHDGLLEAVRRFGDAASP
jgi:predicted anti-sigma-YlaC factor YlaD